MMTAAGAILVLVLSNQGYWFGGRTGTIDARWAIDADLPRAALAWDLSFGTIGVASGVVAVDPANPPSTIRITLPEVRVPTAFQWDWRLLANDREIARGSQTIHAYPQDLLAGVKQRLAGRRLVVWDSSDGLPAALEQAGIAFTRVQQGDQLAFARAEIVLVGPGRISDRTFAQAALLGQVTGGGSVMVFQQQVRDRLAGYPLLARPVPQRIEYDLEHPLLHQFDRQALRSFLLGQDNLWALQLPADEAALVVAGWPRETPGEEPVPTDALLVVRSDGKGRLVLCQMPFGDWTDDPRSQLFLRNSLDYLVTRPEPTPPPSQRRPEPVPQKKAAPSVIALPGGAR